MDPQSCPPPRWQLRCRLECMPRRRGRGRILLPRSPAGASSCGHVFSMLLSSSFPAWCSAHSPAWCSVHREVVAAHDLCRHHLRPHLKTSAHSRLVTGDLSCVCVDADLWQRHRLRSDGVTSPCSAESRRGRSSFRHRDGPLDPSERPSLIRHMCRCELRRCRSSALLCRLQHRGSARTPSLH